MEKKEIENKVKAISVSCHQRCGLNYELYCDLFTVRLNSFLACQTESVKKHGYEVAKKYGWEEPGLPSREPDECVHHFTYDTCPLGCGERKQKNDL